MTASRLPSFLVLWAAVLSVAVGAEGSGHVWSKGFGDASEQSVGGIAVDNAGNLVATGSFFGTVDFGGGPLTSAGQQDVFVAKFDANGNHVWSKSFGDTTAQAGLSVAVDGSGNVIATGSFNGTVNFGGGPLTSAGAADIFLVKFDTSGNFVWGKRFGDANTQTGYDVAVDGSSNLITAGSFLGSVNFGGGALTSAGLEDIYLAKLDPSGTHLWSKRFGDATSQDARGLAVGSSGNVAITGGFQGTVDLGGGPLASAGGTDIFLASYDPNGNHLWSRGFGDASVQRGYDLAVDGSGNVIVTGGFEGAVDFGSGALTSAGAADIFLAAHDPVGIHIWSRAFGGAGTDTGSAIAADGPGNVVVTGSFEGTVDFGGGPLVGSGGAEILLARYGPNGQHLSSERFGDAAAQHGWGVALDGPGNAFLTGQFRGMTDFGGGPLTSAGAYDIFLAKFADLIFEDGFES